METLCLTCHQDAELPRSHYTPCPDCRDRERPAVSPEMLRARMFALLRKARATGDARWHIAAERIGRALAARMAS